LLNRAARGPPHTVAVKAMTRAVLCSDEFRAQQVASSRHGRLQIETEIDPGAIARGTHSSALVAAT
jgi:hypothetical protein